MDKEEKNRTSDDSGGEGAIYVVGIGPGGLEHLTQRAHEAIALADSVVGYTRYVDLIRPLTAGKTVFSTGMTHEVERCKEAVRLAKSGRKVAVVSSGDAGVYGMAGLIMELAIKDGGEGIKIEVVPGIPAFISAASILGAPLMHDFASISLSDLLTDWEKIEKRLVAASDGDFVIILYNPRSSKRIEGLSKAIEIIRRFRGKDTPLGLVRNATRDGEETSITTLGNFEEYYDKVDMLSIIIIGNSTTFTANGTMITPRGYNV